MVVGVSKHQRADEDALLLPSQHREPQRRGIDRSALQAQPGARRQPVGLRGARGDQLLVRGDLTGARVDEEQSHGPRG